MSDPPKLPDSPLAALHEESDAPGLDRWRRTTLWAAISLAGAYAAGVIAFGFENGGPGGWVPSDLEEAITAAVVPAPNLLLAMVALLLLARVLEHRRRWATIVTLVAVLVGAGYV